MKECSGKAGAARTLDPIVGEVYEDSTDGQLLMCIDSETKEFVALTHSRGWHAGRRTTTPNAWANGFFTHKPNACICKDGCGK
jgi:hypothetical protein